LTWTSDRPLWLSPKKLPTSQKKKVSEFGQLLNDAGNLLTIGSLEGFILAQAINTLPRLVRHEKEEMCKAISYFENLARRRRFHRTMREELSDQDWEIKLFPRQKEEAV